MNRWKLYAVFGLMFLAYSVARAIPPLVTGLTLVSQPSANFAVSSQNNPVLAYQVAGPPGGADTLTYFALDNNNSSQPAATGTPPDIAVVNLWYQSSSGPFSPGLAVSMGPVTASSHYTWNSNYNFPVTVGDYLFVTTDLTSVATAGDNFQVTQQNGYVTFGSGLVFPTAGPVTNAQVQTIVNAGVPLFNLLTVLGGNVLPGTTDYPVFGAQIQVTGAVPVSQVTIFKTGTAVSTDFAIVKLWDEPNSAGPNFNQAQASYVTSLNPVGGNHWQNPANNWNVQNNDYLFITADVAAGAVGGGTPFNSRPNPLIFNSRPPTFQAPFPITA